VLLSRSSEAAALTLRLDGYEELALAVVPDRERTEKAKLVKIRATITIHLESTPPGASVVKAGAVIGTTPHDDQFLEDKGSVTYTLRLDGHRDQRIKVAADQSTSKAVTLKAKAAVKAPCRPPAARAPGTGPRIYIPNDGNDPC
jgi:hypothetical protein